MNKSPDRLIKSSNRSSNSSVSTNRSSVKCNKSLVRLNKSLVRLNWTLVRCFWGHERAFRTHVSCFRAHVSSLRRQVRTFRSFVRTHKLNLRRIFFDLRPYRAEIRLDTEYVKGVKPTRPSLHCQAHCQNALYRPSNLFCQRAFQSFQHPHAAVSMCIVYGNRYATEIIPSCQQLVNCIWADDAFGVLNAFW